MKRRSIEYRLHFANRVLTNAQASPEIREAVEQYGYDSKRLQEGQALYDKANQLYVDQIKEYSEQYGASNALTQAYEKATDVYMVHVKIARMALRDDFELYLALKLKGKRERTYDKWLAQANAFYSLALSNRKIQDALAYLGIGKVQLEEGYRLVKDVEEKSNIRSLEMGDAQKATLLRDEAMEELDQWIADFITISHIALEESPQDLEKLGIVV